MKRFVTLSICSILLVGPLDAAPLPAWWSAIIDPVAQEDNNAPLATGQLKFTALKAKEYLDTAMPGGAGADINNIVANFEPKVGVTYSPADLARIKRENLAPASIGQLKNITERFYARLEAAGFFPRIHLIARGYPSSWAYARPWATDQPLNSPRNLDVANIGQLKLIFSFTFGDSDSDGLLDSYESQVTGQSGGNGDWLWTLDGDGVADADGDGISDLAESQIGWNPLANNLNNATETETLVYDGAHRLINVTGRSVLGYTPDAGGNVKQTQ